MHFAHLTKLSTGQTGVLARSAAAALNTDQPSGVSRRGFLKASAALSGGLVLGFVLPGESGTGRASHLLGGLFGDTAAALENQVYPPNAFIRIGTDDNITVIVNKLEFGQGVFTSLPMLIAEELDCDWSRISAEHAPVAPVYNHPAFGIQITGGSQSINSSWEQFRTIGASARIMLINAAAQQWNVDPKLLSTHKGVVTGPGGKKATYGSLADAAAKLPVPEKVALKPFKDFNLIGKPTRRIDSQAKVNGTAQFGLDKTLPGMKVAVVARPPVFGGKVKEQGWTTRPVKGAVRSFVITTERGGRGVAVVADTFWEAKTAREKLEISWEAVPDTVRDALNTDTQMKQYHELAQQPGNSALKLGDVASAEAAKTVTADFEFPYLAHAPMEPLNCVIDLKADSCKVWAGSQFQTVDAMAIARTAGLKPEQVELTTMLAGGGFGRRAVLTSDYLVEAVNVAKAMREGGMDAPVKVIWTREDDIKGGFYRPAHVHHVVASVDAKGKISAWNHSVVGQSIAKGSPFESMMVKDGVDGLSVEGIVDQPYAIPNINVSAQHPSPNVPVLWWRSVGHSHTSFVMETMIDELAAAARQDPVKFRLAHLDPKETRFSETLKLAAAKSGWGKPLPKGHAHGIALHESFGTVVAHVAEVSIDGGQIKVHKVTSAVNCGTAVNPLTIEAQVQGAVVFGMSAALYGKITFKDGAVEQSNFSDYPVLRIADMPTMEVHVLPSHEKPTGMGEPGVPPIAPAIANAIYALNGKRLRTLPLTLS